MMNIVWFIIVGAVAGWLGSTLMKMSNGLITNVVIGILGGVIGGWGLGALGVSIGGGLVGEIIVAAIGAMVLLFVYKMVMKA